jgi:hypothetical protein
VPWPGWCAPVTRRRRRACSWSAGLRWQRPSSLSDWDELLTLTGLLSSGPAAPSDPLAGRPSLQLAMFWDAGIWEPYVREGLLGSLRPEQANQFGRF